jgi:GDP-mannose transporter
MSDKKNEDFAIRMPDSPREKDLFIPGRRSPHQRQPSWTSSVSKLGNSPPLSILAYCLSSISMTVVNKYVVSGSSWNLNFFYLAVQVRQHGFPEPPSE